MSDNLPNSGRSSEQSADEFGSSSAVDPHQASLAGPNAGAGHDGGIGASLGPGQRTRTDSSSQGRDLSLAGQAVLDADPLSSVAVPQRAHHHRVGSLVGSLGRQRFQLPLSKYEREHARDLLFSDSLDSSKPSIKPATDDDEDSDEGGEILEEGVFAPTESQRLYHERQGLLSASHVPGYGTTAPEAEASLEPARSIPAADDDPPGWDEAVADGRVSTNWTLEFKVLMSNSAPLVVTFFLQYLLVVSSLFSVGHLGKVELGAVSLGGMTASITGIAFIQGMSTCLDTLCPQAYGAGRPDLVGMYFQKGVLVELVGLIPVMALWYRSDLFLPFIVSSSEEDSAALIELASLYLRVMIFAMPGFVLFECGKRFLQAQNIFYASTMVMMIVAPLNVVLVYVLVWNERIGLGFIGAPVAVAISNALLALFLFLFVIFVDGSKCWNGFTMKVFHNWGPLLRLAIPGLIMVESEFFAYEVMTLAASYLGTTELAAQSILSSATTLAYEIPFAVGCAASTRIANFVGAGLPKAASLSTKVTIFVAFGVAVVDSCVILIFSRQFASLFSNDASVLEMTARYMPLGALMHLFDALGSALAGLLRGQGRQTIGGYLNLLSYYCVGVPLGIVLCFRLNMGLAGIWLGITSALVVVVAGSLLALRMSNWDRYIQKARARH